MLKKDRLYVDFHVLQTVPPSCVNRDDTGSPKTAVYGGVTRHRVSSQAWKRAIRLDFRDRFLEEKNGLRTKAIVQLVSREIRKLDESIAEDKADKKAEDALKKCGLKIKSAEKGTDALFFMSIPQAKEIAKLTVAGEKEKTEYIRAITENPSIDMALFGRMVASDPSLNYDASVQVAHAISTHAVQTEYDYFTAVDDCQADNNAGAGHLGTMEFNSSTLYRYATINVMELSHNLKNKADVLDAVCGFAEAFIYTMPTGKQNSYANRTLPDGVYVTIRKDQPVNLCGAFESPVLAGMSGYVKESKRKLTEYAADIYDNFADEPEKAFCCGKGMESLGETMKLSELINELRKEMDLCVEDCEVE